MMIEWWCYDDCFHRKAWNQSCYASRLKGVVWNAFGMRNETLDESLLAVSSFQWREWRIWLRIVEKLRPASRHSSSVSFRIPKSSFGTAFWNTPHFWNESTFILSPREASIKSRNSMLATRIVANLESLTPKNPTTSRRFVRMNKNKVRIFDWLFNA